MCHLSGARLCTLLPPKCRIPPFLLPPVKKCPKNQSFSSVLPGPFPPTLFPFRPSPFLPLFPSSPPLFKFMPLFDSRKLRFRYTSNLDTLERPAELCKDGNDWLHQLAWLTCAISKDPSVLKRRWRWKQRCFTIAVVVYYPYRFRCDFP